MNAQSIRFIGLTLAVGTLLIGTCAAQVNTAPDATPRTSNPVPSSARLPQNSEQRMAALDRNRDGSISEDEYEDSIRDTFRELDADRNNRVSADELASASAPQQDGMLSPADRIRRIDMNTDGELTEEELERGAEQAFELLDTSNDETLDLGELKSGGG
jgi:Ca2+-binding EF-hand superfamily protein